MRTSLVAKPATAAEPVGLRGHPGCREGHAYPEPVLWLPRISMRKKIDRLNDGCLEICQSAMRRISSLLWGGSGHPRRQSNEVNCRTENLCDNM